MHSEIYWVGPVLTGRLAVMPRPRGGDWLEEEIRALAGERVTVLVCLLQDEELRRWGLESEEALCVANGIEWVHFPIRDHSVPDPDARTTEFLRSVVTMLRQGKAVACHCFAGLGRSVLVAACAMVLAGATPDRAFALIGRARGFPVPDTEEQRAWVERFARETGLAT